MKNLYDLKPFYFIIVVWGEKYLSYLTDYCIPSLLSDNNIPALSNIHQQNKFLICCPSNDWKYLTQHKSFQVLKSYIKPIHIVIDPPTHNTNRYIHMGIGHKIATQHCFENQAYGVALTPDLILSDGAIKLAQKKALEGKHIVYCAAMRFEEESVFKQLHNLSYGPNINAHSKIQLTGRQVAKIALSNLHPQTISYNLDLPYLTAGSPMFYKQLDEGLLLHSLSWCPLLLDYSAIKQHDTSTLDQWTLDGDYVYKNFGDLNIYIIQDSDEVMLLGWTPKGQLDDFLIKQSLTSKIFRKKYYSFLMKYTFYNNTFDPLKLKLFIKPIYIHDKQITSHMWTKHESYFKKNLKKHYYIFIKSKCNYKYKIKQKFYKKIFYSFVCFLRFFQAIKRVIKASLGDKHEANRLMLHPKYGSLFKIVSFLFR